VAPAPFRNDNDEVAPPNPIDRMLGAIVPRAVDAIDIDGVIDQVDVDHVLSGVDVDAVVQRIDVQELMERVDLNELLARVDVTALLQKVDLDALLARVDVDQLIAQLDVNRLAGRLDVDALLARLDVDALVQRVDVGSIVARVDVDGLVGRVDLDALVGRVDVDGLVGRVDVDRVISRVDVEAVIDRVDVNAVVQRVDVDQLMEGVDLPALVQRAQIDAIISDASRGMFTRLLDVVRRQLAGIDSVMIGAANRVFRRPSEADAVHDGTVTGRIAGGVSRLAAFGIDLAVLWFSYGLLTSLGVFLVGLFTGDKVDVTHHPGWWLVGFGLLGFSYYWIGLTITGRSIGKGLIGLRVVRLGGAPMSPGRAAIRTIVYPFSFILGLGLIPIVTGKRRRALHDAAGGDVVLYDWGDRPAELPAPVTAWIRRRAGEADPPTAALVAIPTPPTSDSGGVSAAS
jgi:uncharacterized RDD family membrane protein YckC